MRKTTVRKSSICVIAASAVLAVSGAMPAHAAVTALNIPGGRVIQISGSGSSTDCSQELQKLLGRLTINGNDCVIEGIPGSFWPGVQQPDIQQPDIQQPDTQKPDTGSDQSAFAKEIVSLVNAERAKAGLSPVTLHSQASKAAQVRAQEIRTSFSHTRPGGGNAGTALDQAGVSYRGFGENIAYGQNSAEEVMREWMNSPGHRANILNADFTSLGVGHAENAAGVDYWVQLFLY